MEIHSELENISNNNLQRQREFQVKGFQQTKIYDVPTIQKDFDMTMQILDVSYNPQKSTNINKQPIGSVWSDTKRDEIFSHNEQSKNTFERNAINVKSFKPPKIEQDAYKGIYSMSDQQYQEINTEPLNRKLDKIKVSFTELQVGHIIVASLALVILIFVALLICCHIYKLMNRSMSSAPILNEQNSDIQIDIEVQSPHYTKQTQVL